MLVIAAITTILVFAGVAIGCAPLTAYNTLLPADSGGDIAAREVAYGTNQRQRLDVYVPDIRPKDAPVVVFFYGGSWNSGSKSDYAFVGKAFAARGFVTVIADYRLVPEVYFPDFLTDCAAAVAWTHANAATYGGRSDRIFLLGHSAGAYNAAMIALDARFLAALKLPQSTIRGVATLAGPFDFLPLDVQSTRDTFGRAKDLTATQPISYVTKSAPPFFLATGEDDDTVKPRNTRKLADLLRAAGTDATVKTYKGVGHVGIMLALSVTLRNRAPVLDDVANFFRKHV
jgi:acetyl esterase/lipase